MTAARLLPLDVLRAAAVLLVLGRHLSFLNPTPGSWWDGVTGPLRTGGWIGVDLFFVLSGFLVSGLLFAEFRDRGTLSGGRFLIRRGFKIYPPFYALLAVSLLVLEFGMHVDPPAIRVASEALFFQNYVPGLWSHTWSLAVEEHFYLMLPLALAASKALRGGSDPYRDVIPLCVVVAVVCPALRVGVLLGGPKALWEVIGPTHLRIDSLMFGVLLSYLFHYRRPWLDRMTAGRGALFAMAGAAMLVPAFVFPLETSPLLYPAGLSVVYVGAGLLMLGVLELGVPRNRATVALGVVGRYSYTIYLWHMPVVIWLLPMSERAAGSPLGFGERLALYLVLSIGLGLLAGLLTERPFLWLRDRWFPSRAKGGPIDGVKPEEAPRIAA